MSLACAVSVVNKERFSVKACVGSVGWVSCLGSVAVEVLGNTRAKQQRNKLLLMVNLLIRHDSSLVIILGTAGLTSGEDCSMIQYHYQSYSKYARISIRITTDSIDCSNSIESRSIISAGCRPQW